MLNIGFILASIFIYHYRFLMNCVKLRQRLHSGVFNVNFEHILHIFLVFLLLTFYRLLTLAGAYIKHHTYSHNPQIDQNL